MYEFSLLQLTKKDQLTGVLNRQAFYADTAISPEEITALVSVDMNGLKNINDTRGHAAGDEALCTLALCLLRAERKGQYVYRTGGDEFVIVCRNADQSDVLQLIERIRKNVAETDYSCAIGYSCAAEGEKTFDNMLRESDEMMYAEKAEYYQNSGRDRRRR